MDGWMEEQVLDRKTKMLIYTAMLQALSFFWIWNARCPGTVRMHARMGIRVTTNFNSLNERS